MVKWNIRFPLAYACIFLEWTSLLRLYVFSGVRLGSSVLLDS